MSEQSSQYPDQNLAISDSALETVQIGGVAGRDLRLTQIQGKVGTLNVFESIRVDQTPLNAANSLSRKEYAWRSVLLSKVKQFWIDGVLANSLHTQVLVELGLEEWSHYVPSSLTGVKEFSSEAHSILPIGTSAAAVFEGIGAGRTLLILGEPGAGKTVTLLKLAESLLSRTENDLSQPLPVVVNLSSWAKQQKPIADWLVQELYETYQISKSLGQAWIADEQLILLLDGLDEVQERCRNACVKALNDFIQHHGLTEMVVCCRVHDYEALSEQLMLRSAIYVRPLTSRQIDWYLEQAGEQLQALKAVIQKNSDLKTFASSPLILGVMSLTYKSCAVEELPQSSTVIAWSQRLFDTYIERMFQRRRTTQQYSKKKTLRWLIWLARKMSQGSQTMFLIESLQPSLLLKRVSQIAYRVGFAMLTGLIFGMIYGLMSQVLLEVFMRNEGLLYSLSQGLIIGLLSGVVVGTVVGLSRADINTVGNLKYSWKTARNEILRYALIGVLSGFLVGQIVELIDQGPSGVKAALQARRALTTVRPLDGALGLIAGLTYGITNGLGGLDIEAKTIPNQAIWMSAKSAGIFGLVGGCIGGLVGGLAGGITGEIGDGIISGLSIGLAVGLIGGGSLACIKHFVLRWVLYINGCIPWNYARFLNYAADHLFLQKVGGGYIFVHRMLLEHFAAMEP